MALLDRISETRSPHRRAPVLVTERLALRPPQPGDAKAISILANDRRVAENTLRIPHPYTLADAHAFLASARAARDEMVLVITMADIVIGCCGLARLRHVDLEIGYWLGAPFWGHGYATEAARALLDHAFRDPGHDVLLGGARVSNPASRRVLEKCGFKWTGVELYRVCALSASVPVDRFRLERLQWT
ncbi:MAG: GNAT family N-acetyltransferase [Hyphomicrobiales bacterium]|nr:GNAT family N-acetyltransferase [Hyphomicrobiales bacterium]